MPPAYVKPYVKRQKNDAADAEADMLSLDDRRGIAYERACKVVRRHLNRPFS
jgi:hypothetical protein